MDNTDNAENRNTKNISQNIGQGMRALYYVSLVNEDGSKKDSQDGEDGVKLRWQKANQNRLNQNFSIIRGELEAIVSRLEALGG